MSRYEIRLGGFGGQGVALVGKILGAAASFYAEKQSVMTQSYGPESRGGASASNVVISDAEIDFPYVYEPDVFICFSKDAYSTYIDSMKKGGTLFYESDLVELDDKSKKAKQIFGIPATAIAEKELGRRIVTNIVMLGFFAELTDIVDSKAILKSVLSFVPERFKDLNERAFKIGMDYAKKAKKEEAKK